MNPGSPLTGYSLPGPEDVSRVELPNGIVVLARPNFNSPSVVISGYLPVGNLFDTDEKLGLGSFVASALMRGTTARSFQETYTALESIGASLGFNGGTHTTGFAGKALVEDLDLLVEILAESLCQPSFPLDEIERLRAQILTALSIRAQNTGEMASLAFDKIVYAGHPYSRPEDGYPDTVNAIRREDLEEFHKCFYGPRGMVIAIIGAVDPDQAIGKAAEILGGWKNPEQPDLPALPGLKSLKE